MDLKEKFKRERDKIQDLLAWAHTMFPDATDPVEEIIQILVLEGIYDETDRVAARALEQDYGSLSCLIDAEMIDIDQAQQLLTLLEVRSKALMARVGERMIEMFDVDLNVLGTAENDEK